MKFSESSWKRCFLCLVAAALFSFPLFAADSTDVADDAAAMVEAAATEVDVPAVDSGDNAWLMISSALVLFMTLPGLALFYGGLVRSKNVLSILAQCLGIAGMVTILWWAFGYSLAFGSNFDNRLIGGTEYFFLKGVANDVSGSISHATFCMFQLMFAIITPSLIIGGVAERMKHSAILLFVGLWMFVVYFPLAHMVWGGNGFMNGFYEYAGVGAIDFAGGTVVHMSSGWSALVLCIILGPRLGFGKDKMAPHSMVAVMTGTGMLWFGWYGFNAGSALAADGIAANAFMTTTLSAATAAFTWGMIEKIFRGHASILGFCSGAVGGLVVITPAAGFVSAGGAVLIGLLAGIVPYITVTKLKAILGFDDSLDAFGIHGVGGTLGALLTGILASPETNSGITDLVAQGGLVVEQIKSIGITLVLSVVGTAIIAYIVKAVVGLRPSQEVERQGLDINEHGEEGYIL